MQNLVKANGFIKGFSSITADSNADQALLYTGKAAMMLHGAWTYGNMKASGGDFVTGGHLGYMNFPPVDGGKGDPSNTVGNPGQYLSISSKATDAEKETAKKFFATTTLDDAAVDAWVKSGNMPVVKRQGQAHFGHRQERLEWLKFVYDTSANAKNFAQSWDQALSARPRPRPCSTTSPSCSSCRSPRSSGRQHERGDRQVTTARPAPRRSRPPLRPERRGRAGAEPARSPGWRCRRC